MKFNYFVGILTLGMLALLFQGCSAQAEPEPFSLEIHHEEIKGHSIAGQKVNFLVLVDREGEKNPVDLSASAPGCAVSISHEKVAGEIVEVVVIPEESSIGKTITLTIKAGRDGLEKMKAISFEVIDGEDDRYSTAVEMRDKFIPWIAAEMSELGITPETIWEGTMVSPEWLVVSHYLFFSPDWEMHVAWHNMIPPHDWARIDLRRRYAESTPSYAFEISSISAGGNPIQAELPTEVWR